MDSTFNNPLLFNDTFSSTDDSLGEKYRKLKKIYSAGNKYVLLNNINVFAPFPKPDVPWDISKEQKIATYHPDIVKLLEWVRSKIISNLGIMDYKTLDVLVRIATGMLNKCDIPKDTKILFHENMTHNLQAEHILILNSDLPFQG